MVLTNPSTPVAQLKDRFNAIKRSKKNAFAKYDKLQEILFKDPKTGQMMKNVLHAASIQKAKNKHNKT